MKLEIFSVFDKAVQAYVQPFYARSKGEALRMFTEAVNDEKNNLHKHAGDYSLYYLGQWDDGGAGFAPVDPVRILTALEVMEDVFPMSKKVS